MNKMITLVTSLEKHNQICLFQNVLHRLMGDNLERNHPINLEMHYFDIEPVVREMPLSTFTYLGFKLEFVTTTNTLIRETLTYLS